MINKSKIKNILLNYIKIFPDENFEKIIKKALAKGETLNSRENFFAHITVSAILVNQSLSEVLLIHHKALNKIIQPGGHLEKNDTSLHQAALRELTEEVGINNTFYLPVNEKNKEFPFDIDVHKIPANTKKNEPEHYHIDCRFLFCLVNQQKEKANLSETLGTQWMKIDEVSKIDYDFLRTINKVKKILIKSKDKIFFNSIIENLKFSPKKFNIVLVLHILPDVIEYIKALKLIAKSITIIPKPNSIHKESMSLLKKENIIKVTREELKNTSVLKKIFDKKEKYLIMDIGGYFADPKIMAWNNRSKKISGIVEDTENGLKKYLAIEKKLNFPVISVARSKLKKNEDDLVGYNVAYYTEMIIRQFRFFPRYMRCGLIGYGKLGRGIAKYLFNQNIKPLIFDKNKIKMVEAYKDGCIPTNKTELLMKSDLLFCATGGKSLSENDFLQINSGASIASVTSSDDEFDLSKLHNHFSINKINKFITKVENSNRHFFLINHGNAVNFIGSDQVGDFIRLVQAEIIVGFSIFNQKNLPNKINLNTEKKTGWIANTFLKVFLGLD